MQTVLGKMGEDEGAAMISWMRPRFQTPRKRVAHWMIVNESSMADDPMAKSSCGNLYRRLGDMVFDLGARKCETCLERMKAEEDGNVDFWNR